MKHFDNSRPGNDCMICEHWYWISEPEPCAVRLRKVSGYGAEPIMSAAFTNPNDDMPAEVRAWFDRGFGNLTAR